MDGPRPPEARNPGPLARGRSPRQRRNSGLSQQHRVLPSRQSARRRSSRGLRQHRRRAHLRRRTARSARATTVAHRFVTGDESCSAATCTGNHSYHFVSSSGCRQCIQCMEYPSSQRPWGVRAERCCWGCIGTPSAARLSATHKWCFRLFPLQLGELESQGIRR